MEDRGIKQIEEQIRKSDTLLLILKGPENVRMFLSRKNLAGYTSPKLKMRPKFERIFLLNV